jgi:ferredoxin
MDVAGLEALLERLRAQGHELLGPRVRDAAIVLGPVSSLADLPRGVGDEQSPGRYRLRERADSALFGYAACVSPLKRELLLPRVPLVQLRLRAGAVEVLPRPAPQRKLAVIGVRACELAALAVQDRVLCQGAHRDADYAARRAQLFIVAVHCHTPADTCFCAALGSGPRARSGHDLALYELLEPEPRYVVEIGSAAGAALLAGLPGRAATPEELAAAADSCERAASAMTRKLPDPARLWRALEHPHWDAVAERCLGCANCTMVCPTCFCTTLEDTTDLSGELATRTRRWDSCFSPDFAYVAGGSSRPTLRARYRQWLTHKLATWQTQFGVAGCVGCGRCITFCPAGIDLTVEAGAVVDEEGASGWKT